MSLEVQMLTTMAKEQAALAVQLLDVGDTGCAKNQFREVIQKIDMIEAVQPNQKPTTKQITIEA